MVILANNTIHNISSSGDGKYSCYSLDIFDVSKAQIFEAFREKYGEEFDVYEGEAYLTTVSQNSVRSLINYARSGLDTSEDRESVQGSVQFVIIALVAFLEDFVKYYLLLLLKESKTSTTISLYNESVRHKGFTDLEFNRVKVTTENSLKYLENRIHAASGLAEISSFYNELVGGKLSDDVKADENDDVWKHIQALTGLRNLFAHGHRIEIGHTLSEERMKIIPIETKTFKQLKSVLESLGRANSMLNSDGVPNINQFLEKDIAIHFWKKCCHALEQLYSTMHPREQRRLSQQLSLIQKLPKINKI